MIANPVSEKDVQMLLRIIAQDYEGTSRLQKFFDFGLYVHRLWQMSFGYNNSSELAQLEDSVLKCYNVKWIEKAKVMADALLADSLFSIMAKKELDIEKDYNNTITFDNYLTRRSDIIQTICRVDAITTLPKYGKTVLEYKTIQDASDNTLDDSIYFFKYDASVYHYLETTQADTLILFIGNKKNPKQVFKRVYKRTDFFGKNTAEYGYSNWNLFMSNL